MPYTPGQYSGSGGYTPGMYSAAPSLGQQALGVAQGVVSRGTQGAVAGIPGTASLQTLTNPRATGPEKAGAVAGDIGGAALGVATGGASIPAGMAINASLEASGIGPLARKAEGAIEGNAIYHDPQTQSVAANFAGLIPKYAAGSLVGMAPSLAAGLAMGKVQPKTATQTVPSDEALPALTSTAKKGIPPLQEATAAGSGLNDVYESVRSNRTALGNKIGDVVSEASKAAFPIDSTAFQKEISSALDESLKGSGRQTGPAKAVLAKWKDSDLPDIKTLEDLHQARLNFSDSIEGHLGKEGDASAVPMSAMRNTLGDILEKYIPGPWKPQFQEANKNFANYATIEDGIKAATPGLSQVLRDKTPNVGESSSLALDPAKYSKWWNEGLMKDDKARLDPELVNGMDALTKQTAPNPVVSGIKAAGKGAARAVIPAAVGSMLGAPGAGEIYGLYRGLETAIPAYKNYQNPTPTFKQTVPTAYANPSMPFAAALNQALLSKNPLLLSGAGRQ